MTEVRCLRRECVYKLVGVCTKDKIYVNSQGYCQSFSEVKEVSREMGIQMLTFEVRAEAVGCPKCGCNEVELYCDARQKGRLFFVCTACRSIMTTTEEKKEEAEA